ncbi:hypothetical protein BDK88_1676 [Natrinema hispanicum]|uniref:Uncharacterized protein n=1 Tax=Natrinema hispanicum TaxID=392421 RepID=A0A482YAW1_9EURY|nr:hypothetical protein [Natrinema hispanicum]RZV10508.1 hypothetical protein BDK88_1676 [Natrinema hispanicum]
MVDWLLLMNIVPFLAIIFIEYFSQSIPSYYEDIFRNHFDSSEYVSGDWQTTLEQTGIETDIENVAGELEEEADTMPDKIRPDTRDYLTYATDRIQTRTNLAITAISVIIIITLRLISLNNPSELVVDTLAFLLAGIGIASIIAGVFLERRFQEIDPHEYSRTNWRGSIFSIGTAYVIGINLAAVIVIAAVAFL